MIKTFVDAWTAGKNDAREMLKDATNYRSIVTAVVRVIADNMGEDICYSDKPDPDRVHQIDNGCYQGTLVFLIAAQEYQPDTYWYVKVSYGSCSVCDALESALAGDQTIDDLMTLALHIVQGLRELGSNES